MFKLKGKYEWKLVDSETGNIEQQGEQWNLISDAFLEWYFRCEQACYYNGMAIVLSDTIPSESIDYRRLGNPNVFNVLSTGSIVADNFDTVTMSKYCDNNFAPPGIPITINVIGIKLFRNGSNISLATNFASFIKLSSPITQSTTQYLYVKYTVYFIFDISLGNNTPNNRFVNYVLNNNLCTGQFQICCRGQNDDTFRLTPFLPPTTLNNVSRDCFFISKSNSNDYVTCNNATSSSNIASRLSATINRDFVTSDIVGFIGTTTFSDKSYVDISMSVTRRFEFNCTWGHSQNKSMVPSISRVFVHPSSRDEYVFSDPSYPASSRGTVSASGTPSNSYPCLMRVRITKTGDATDLVDETVSYTAINTSTSQITISQDFTVGDIYQVSTTGSLPSPLVVSTNYYVIRVDSTHIKLATSYANAIVGSYITLTTQGSGNHTFIRQNTGKYQLEMEPWNYSYLMATKYSQITQLPMAIDYDNYIMPSNLGSGTEYAEGDYVANSDDSYNNNFYNRTTGTMLRGTAKNGDFIYSVQQSRKGLINNICRWRFNSIETSQAICKFGNGSTRVVSSFSDSNYMYITTNDGIYQYVFSTPTVAPVLLSITGMISSTILDACLDPVTGYIWTGHATGLSRINVNTLVATQYISGTGQALEGMTSTYYAIGPGQLDAYNGRVLKGGYTDSSHDMTTWVLDDGVGWYRINVPYYACCIDRGTSNIVVTTSTNLYLYNVTVTGRGTGTHTQVETFSFSPGISHIGSQITQIAKNVFYFVYASPYYYAVTYKKGSGITNFQQTSEYWNVSDSNKNSYSLCAFRRNPIDVGNGLIVFFWYNYLFAPFLKNTCIPFGWNGTNWEKDLYAPRDIPKTISHTALNGLSLTFNNATGSSWDTQFVLNESFNIAHGPYQVKDNLQTMTWKAKQFLCNAIVVENYESTVSVSVPYVITIPEASNVNFRDLDMTDFTTEVSQNSNIFQRQNLVQYSTVVQSASSTVNFGINIPTGTPVVLMSVFTGPSDPGEINYPLEDGKTYYAINYNSTSIRLAATYADAIAGIYIIITSYNAYGSGTRGFVILPSQGYYYSTASGDFFFNSADAGKATKLTYTYTQFSL